MPTISPEYQLYLMEQAKAAVAMRERKKKRRNHFTKGNKYFYYSDLSPWERVKVLKYWDEDENNFNCEVVLIEFVNDEDQFQLLCDANDIKTKRELKKWLEERGEKLPKSFKGD